MKKTIGAITIGVLVGFLLTDCGIAQTNQKLAQTSFGFLSVVSDARAAAMADAVTSLQIGSSALFFNPAGMSAMDGFIDVTASNNQWFADIRHYTFGVAVSPFKGDYGVLGFSIQYVDYGGFTGTRVDRDPLSQKGYVDVGIFKLNALAIGVGYAKQLTDQFSVGGQVRWARQDLGDSFVPNDAPSRPVFDGTGTTILYYADSARTASNRLTPFVFDFGTQFRTGFKSLVFGMSVRNFSKDIQYVYEGFQLPLVFTLGISMNIMDLVPKLPFDQSLYLSVDASHYRDHPEQLKIGLDYRIMNMLSLRGGYATNSDESGFSYGVGISKYGFAFDYSYTPYGIFQNVQRMTARFSF
jgi:hypothetical protein